MQRATKTRSGRAFITTAAIGLAAAAGMTAAAGAGAIAAGHSSPRATGPGHVTLVLRSTSLGKVVAVKGADVVYLFESDTSHKSSCSNLCASAWPPVVTSGKPRVGAGLSSKRVGTITRSNGDKQVTYGGHPLYFYSLDSKTTAVNGEGVTSFGSVWEAVSKAGHKVVGGGGGGYGGY